MNREEGDAWVKELEDDVRQECEDKYGHVVHISLDPNTKETSTSNSKRRRVVRMPFVGSMEDSLVVGKSVHRQLLTQFTAVCSLTPRICDPVQDKLNKRYAQYARTLMVVRYDDRNGFSHGPVLFYSLILENVITF